MALDELLNPGEWNSGAVGDLLADGRALCPTDSFEREEARYPLADASDRLAGRDRLVVTL